MEGSLSGKLALVTGATGGIGAATAELLVRSGARVRLSARSSDRLDALSGRLRALSGDVEAVPGDLADAETIARLVPEGAEPDVVVHAAGHHFRYAKLHAEDPEDAALVWRIDYDALAQLVRLGAPAMMARRFGRIVAVSSIAAALSGAGTARYTAAKAAVEGLVRAIALDYGRFGVTANAVAPGFVATERFRGRAGDQDMLEGLTSVHRIAAPHEIAAPIVFLCSPAASYVTGTTLIVSGGAHLNHAW